MKHDTTCSREELRRMTTAISPSWRIRDATSVDAADHIVYVLDLETETGEQHAVLKATPDGASPTCNSEARMQRILEAHTNIPVPDVFGVVDDHDALPAPFVLQSHLPGRNYRRDVIQSFSQSNVEALAYSTGRHLAELHSLEAVNAFGFISIECRETLTGGRPSSDLNQIVVDDPSDSWESYLADSTTELLAALEGTRFADERDRIEPATQQCAECIVGEFDPVVARIDSAIDDVLLDPETSEVTGMHDWEFCMAAAPTYDLVFVLHSLVDSFWSLLPTTPNYRETAEASLLSGYERDGEPQAIEQYHANKERYNLLVGLHSMLNFENWFDCVGIEGNRRNHAADQLRARLHRFN